MILIGNKFIKKGYTEPKDIPTEATKNGHKRKYMTPNWYSKALVIGNKTAFKVERV